MCQSFFIDCLLIVWYENNLVNNFVYIHAKQVLILSEFLLDFIKLNELVLE